MKWKSPINVISIQKGITMRSAYIIPVLLLVLPVLLFGADRVVLLEDFTNYQCGPCWSFEPTLNNFINSHPDDLAAIRPHVWWPGSGDPIYQQNVYEQWHRVQLYGVNSVPWIQFDGVIKASSSGSGLNSAFNNRIAVPCYLEIQVSNFTTGGTGSIIITLIAEQDLGGDDIFCNAVLVESNVPGAGYWNNSVFEQAFRDELLGPVGAEVSFGPDYPDTLDLLAEYDTGTWDFEYVDLAVFVQNHGASKEVYNAWFDHLGAVVGIEEGESGVADSDVQLDVYPNPSTGNFTITALNLPGSGGELNIYDISGRCVAAGTIDEGIAADFNLNTSGIYFAEVISGNTVTVNRIVVIK